MIHNVFTFFRSIHHTSIVIPSGINPGANEFKTVWIFVTPSPTLIANGVSTATRVAAIEPTTINPTILKELIILSTVPSFKIFNSEVFPCLYPVINIKYPHAKINTSNTTVAKIGPR